MRQLGKSRGPSFGKGGKSDVKSQHLQGCNSRLDCKRFCKTNRELFSKKKTYGIGLLRHEPGLRVHENH
jgi:hypothetical protein